MGLYESRRCPNCQNWDALVLLNTDPRRVPQKNGADREVEVATFRCIFCGVSELVKRDAVKLHEKDETVAGQPFWSDGLIFAARPPTEEVT